jgi:hypothetical protein
MAWTTPAFFSSLTSACCRFGWDGQTALLALPVCVFLAYSLLTAPDGASALVPSPLALLCSSRALRRISAWLLTRQTRILRLPLLHGDWRRMRADAENFRISSPHQHKTGKEGMGRNDAIYHL